MLKQRIITAVVLAVGLLSALVGLSDDALVLMMALVLLVGAWEWAGLSGSDTWVSRVAYILFLGFVLVGLWWASAYNGKIPVFDFRLIVIVGALWWGLALLCVATYPSSARFWAYPFIQCLIGVFVLVPPLFAMVSMIQAEGGRFWVLFLILLVASADIGAFFSGRRFGRLHLAARVSPGKTLEGVAGGLCSVALLTTAVFGYLVWSRPFPDMPSASWWQWLLVAVVTALASVLGDLNESMFKRHRGIKDSGTILPGHGGVLDRIDGLTAALPVFMLMAWANGLIDPPTIGLITSGAVPGP